jgi:hypothetical protein
MAQTIAESVMRALAVGLVLLVGLSTGAGCGSHPGAGGNGDAGSNGDGAGGDGRGTGIDGGSNGGDQPAGGCASAQDCPTGEVCDPATGRCVAHVECTTAQDCGTGAVCQNGTCQPNVSGGPCTDSSSCIPGEMCTGGFCGCGGQAYSAQNVPPNVLIVLDRSDSMNDPINNDGTKWQVALAAINTILATYGDQVRFGLALFPGENQSCSQGMSCGPGVVFIDVGAGTSMGINDFLAQASTCHFGTPTAEMLTTLVTDPQLGDTQRSNSVLLITDGMSTCNDPVPVVTMLRGRTPEVRTFVIGFGDAVDPQELTDMAQAGGTARMGTPAYYQADSAADLGNALGSIVGSVLSCSYQLDARPPDPDQLYVYFDRTLVGRDAADMNGWDYDMATNQVTFYGAACDVLKTGQVTDLAIVYGCPRSMPGQPPPDGGVPQCVADGMTCTPGQDVCCDPNAGCYTRTAGGTYSCISLRPQG